MKCHQERGVTDASLISCKFLPKGRGFSGTLHLIEKAPFSLKLTLEEKGYIPLPHEKFSCSSHTKNWSRS